MGTYPSKHKPNTPVWKPLRPMSARAPRGPSLYVVLLYRPPPLFSLSLLSPSSSRKVPAARFLTPTPRCRMPDSGPLRPFGSLSPASPLAAELLVQRLPRCSDGDRPYLTAAATAPNPSSDGRGVGGGRGTRRGRREREKQKQEEARPAKGDGRRENGHSTNGGGGGEGV